MRAPVPCVSMIETSCLVTRWAVLLYHMRGTLLLLPACRSTPLPQHDLTRGHALLVQQQYAVVCLAQGIQDPSGLYSNNTGPGSYSSTPAGFLSHQQSQQQYQQPQHPTFLCVRRVRVLLSVDYFKQQQRTTGTPHTCNICLSVALHENGGSCVGSFTVSY